MSPKTEAPRRQIGATKTAPSAIDRANVRLHPIGSPRTAEGHAKDKKLAAKREKALVRSLQAEEDAKAAAQTVVYSPQTMEPIMAPQPFPQAPVASLRTRGGKGIVTPQAKAGLDRYKAGVKIGKVHYFFQWSTNFLIGLNKLQKPSSRSAADRRALRGSPGITRPCCDSCVHEGGHCEGTKGQAGGKAGCKDSKALCKSGSVHEQVQGEPSPCVARLAPPNGNKRRRKRATSWTTKRNATGNRKGPHGKAGKSSALPEAGERTEPNVSNEPTRTADDGRKALMATPEEHLEEIEMMEDLDGQSVFLKQPSIISFNRLLYTPRLFDIISSAYCTVCVAE